MNSKIQSRTSEQLEKATQHGENQAISFFFKAVKGKQKNETIQKWVSALTEIHAQNVKNNVESKAWTVRIVNGDWVTNKYGRKLFFKIASDN